MDQISKDIYINSLLKGLKESKLTAGGKEIMSRCPYCNSPKRKFYVSIPEDKELSFFNCFRASCSAKGIVTTQKLIDWGIYEPELGVVVQGIVSNADKRFNVNKLNLNAPITEHINYHNIRSDEVSEYKLAYINKRLGSNLTYADCVNLKIVLNLSDILIQNPIAGNNLTRNKFIVDQLDNNFLGFLSIDNSFVNLRNLELQKVADSINTKYINYNIFDKPDNTYRFYTVPSKIDLYRPVKIHIAEGAFDILGIYLNLRTNEHDNAIFSAVGGSGYIGIVKFFLNTMRIPNSEFHIYPDNDITRYVMDTIADLLHPFNIGLYIHHNLMPGEKDFGVPKERIKESIEKVI